MPPRLVTLVSALVVVAALRPAPAQDAPPVDPSAILAELTAIKEGKNQELQQSLARAIASVRESSSSGGNSARAFADSQKTVVFDGKPNGATDFSDWRRKKSDLLQDRDFQTAAQLHLRYLLLSLQQSADPKNPERIGEILVYVKDYQKAFIDSKGALKSSEEAKALLEKPVQEGVFARALQVSETLGNLKDWEKVAGNVEGILNSGVRRLLREKKDPRLLETWDIQIDMEKAAVAATGADLDQTKFTTVRLPQLYWQKASDAATLGQPNRALTAMVDLIRQNPTHPDREKWIEQATAAANALSKP